MKFCSEAWARDLHEEVAVDFYNMGGCGLHVFAYKGFEKGNGAREPHLLIPA